MGVTTVGSPTPGTHQAGTGTTIATTRNGIVPGNTIVCAVTCGDAFSITSVSDGVVTLTIPDIVFHWVGGTQWLALFSFPNHSGGNFTFTANYGGLVPFRGLDIIELTPSQFDASSSGSGTSAAPSSGSVSPSADGCYIVGFCLGATALTAGAGFTDLVNDAATNTSDLEGLAQSIKAAIAATWTMTSGIWGALAASYRPVTTSGGLFSTRGRPGVGPRDRRGFLKSRTWDFSIATAVAQSADGSAIGVANALVDAQLPEAGSAVGVATESADSQLLTGGSAVGVAAASASEQEVEQGSAAGIATASASALLLEGAAGSGVAIIGSGLQLLEAAAAVGSAVASATDQEAESASGAGVAIAGADSQLEILNSSGAGVAVTVIDAQLESAGTALGEAVASLNIPNAVAIGAGNASADAILLSGGSATGQADAAGDTPPAVSAIDLGDGLPGYHSAVWVQLPPVPMIAGGKARGGSHATAEPIEVYPVPALVITEILEDDDLEMMFFFELAAA